MIYADIFLHMNTADANGTGMTTTIAANGTAGGSVTFTANPSTPIPGLTIEAHRIQRFDTVALINSVSGKAGVFGPNSTTRAMKYNHNGNSGSTLEVDFAAWTNSGYPRCTAFGYVTLGPINAGLSSALFDYLGIFGQTGLYAMFQLNNGNGQNPGDYFVNIETAPGGVTTHSKGIRVIPGGTYWFNLYADFNWKPGQTAGVTVGKGGIAKLGIWQPFTGQCLGVAEVQTLATTDKVDTLGNSRIGNNEAGTDANSSYFEHIGYDIVNARFPILPQWHPSGQSPNQFVTAPTAVPTPYGSAWVKL